MSDLPVHVSPEWCRSFVVLGGLGFLVRVSVGPTPGRSGVRQSRGMFRPFRRVVLGSAPPSRKKVLF